MQAVVTICVCVCALLPNCLRERVLYSTDVILMFASVLKSLKSKFDEACNRSDVKAIVVMGESFSPFHYRKA